MLDAYKLRDFETYANWRDYITNQETSTCIYSNILRNTWNKQKEERHNTKNKRLRGLSTKLFFYAERTDTPITHSQGAGDKMKFTKKNVLPSKKCISHKCKTCSQAQACDLMEKLEKEYEPLLYKPFENLKELLNGKNKQ